jgi:hypothetical protein
MIRTTSVIIRKGKAYLPTSALMGGHGYLEIEPVYVTDLNLDELTEALERIVAAGNPVIPIPTREEMKRRRDPVLKAAGVRSWNALAKGGAAYAIEWTKDEIILYLPMWDEKGRFAAGIGDTLRFPPDTDVRTLSKAILDDARSRPELW